MTSTNRQIAVLGAVHLASLTIYTALSWGLNLVKPLSVQDQRVDFYRRVVAVAPLVGPALAEKIEALDSLARPQVFLLAYCAPVLASTCTFLALLALLAKRHPSLDVRSARRVFGFAVAGAVLCAPALPVLADDFWLSVVWGRMVAAGVNPYSVPMTESFVGGTPFEALNWTGLMNWGPLWAALAGATMRIARARAGTGAVLFKILVAGAWILTLWRVRSMLARRSPWAQCVGVATFGWLPASVVHGVAEGHNDVVVALLVALWIDALRRDHGIAASLALAASVAVKYVTAPLFLLDALHHLRGRGRPAASYAPRAAAALALVAGAILWFHGLLDFATHFARMENWGFHFFSPRQAIVALETLIAYPLAVLRVAAVALFPVVAVVLVARYVRGPAEPRFIVGALAILCAVLFSAISYVWPWYMLWVLVPAALAPRAGLARWILGVALAVPFPLLIENAFPAASPQWTALVPTLAFYATALAWFLLAPRGLVPNDEGEQEVAELAADRIHELGSLERSPRS